MNRTFAMLLLFGLCLFVATTSVPADTLQPIKYNHPGLQVDLGVGLWAWPLPMDYDRDGDHDLVVVCPDWPYNGTYFFENTQGQVKLPIFKPAVRLGPAIKNAQLSIVGGEPHVLAPAQHFPDFRGSQSRSPIKLPVPANVHGSKVRANQWRMVDYDGDAVTDLVIGVGDWAEYGWDNAFDEAGNWTRGPLHGYVYLLRNAGSNKQPRYEQKRKLTAAGKPIDVFGMPSPNFADFDGDGDLDLICGEFLDGFSYFQNLGTRTQPRYAAARRLHHGGRALRMDLQMITPTAIDWDHDGDVDLICGDEDGRVALIEHTGQTADQLPVFQPPVYFQQQADNVKFGALVCPVSRDWDGDGDEDLICGNTAGYIGLIENLDGGDPPRWAAPRYLSAAGKTIRIQAGPNGSIQGPCEAKWGYTTLSVADWNHDGLDDLVVNSIWGKVVWFENVGSRQAPQYAEQQPIQVAWTSNPTKPAWVWFDPENSELVTQWRTTPVVVDWNQDRWNDLIVLDHEGYLVLLERKQTDAGLVLLPPRRVFASDLVGKYNSKGEPQNKTGGLLQLNIGTAGKSGRRKLCVVDWDQDGKLDLLVNSRSTNFLRNVGLRDGLTVFKDEGQLGARRLAGHTTSPTTVDWNHDGVGDLLIGAEDGFLYHLANPRSPR